MRILVADDSRRPHAPAGAELVALPFDIGARTDRLRLVNWDPALTRLDHADFFTRARGVLTSVYDERWSGVHARTPFDAAYRSSAQR